MEIHVANLDLFFVSEFIISSVSMDIVGVQFDTDELIKGAPPKAKSFYVA